MLIRETGAGIEPAHGSFANYSVTTSPPGQLGVDTVAFLLGLDKMPMPDKRIYMFQKHPPFC